MLAEKECTKCKQIKPADAFRRRSELRSGLASWCRKCTSAHCNGKTPERRARSKKRLIEMLGGACQACGGMFPHYCCDFHHRNPDEKEIAMTDLQDKRWDRVLAEVKKCLLLCANCHRIAHHGARAP